MSAREVFGDEEVAAIVHVLGDLGEFMTAPRFRLDHVALRIIRALDELHAREEVPDDH